jgi:hypothetical protein
MTTNPIINLLVISLTCGTVGLMAAQLMADMAHMPLLEVVKNPVKSAPDAESFTPKFAWWFVLYLVVNMSIYLFVIISCLAIFLAGANWFLNNL